MNRLLLTALIALGLAVSAQAVATAGFTAGYLIDNEEEYLTARIGTVFNSKENVIHTGEFEIGYTSMSHSEDDISGSLDILPLMANYRALFAGNGKVGGYFGAGLGMARAKLGASGMGVNLSDSDWTFAMQAFGGISYKLSETSALEIGARYINLQDVTYFEDIDGGFEAELGDDIAIEVGLHFTF